MAQAAMQRILLVDDEPQILVALEDLLSDQFLVHTADSAEGALRLMDELKDIAVVVTDQRMPKMSGDELVSRLAYNYGAQRILVTGYADLGAVVRAVNEGRIFAYATKPWNEDDLRLKVTRAADQFRLAQELDAERQLLHELMDNSPDGIYFKDRNLNFLRTNRAFSDWLGARSDELVGRSLRELEATFENIDSIDRLEQRVVERGEPVVDLMSQVHLSGKARWLSETKAPVRSGDGSVVGVVGISRDVTNQLQLEQQLLQSQKMDAVGRLAGGVAHDFNNLLVVIKSYGLMVMESMDAADPGKEDMAELLKATERAAALTKQLLTFSRSQPQSTQTLDLNAVVADVAKMLRRLIDERIELVVNVGESDALVRGDLTQVEQILLNLTINARDAMPDGGTITVTVTEAQGLPRSESSEPYVVLLVKDNGIGMPSEIRKRIFEPFFSTKEVGKGTGLGLSTVYGIVKQTGGHILVESEVGRGTEFQVYLPRVTGSSTETEHTSRRPPVDEGTATILIVEDDASVRRVAVRVLTRQGYNVLEAATPVEAEAILSSRSGPIDLLVSDVVMPQKTGPQFYADLLNQYPGLRVLFMSGYVETEIGGYAVPEGVPFLEKPFSPGQLLEEVRTALVR